MPRPRQHAAPMRAMAVFALAVALVLPGLGTAAEVAHWRLLRPGGRAPQPLQWAAFARDPAAGRLVLFGGTDQVRDYNEVWALSLAKDTEEWSLLRPAGLGPDARRRASAAFDPLGNRMVIFGGYITERSRHSNETWFLDFTDPAGAWQRYDRGARAPPARRGATLIAQTVEGQGVATNRLILYGGVDADRQFGDVWEFSLEKGQEAWRELRPCGKAPPKRDGHVAVYDAAGNRMIVFGGWSRTRTDTALGDLWSLDLTPGGECWSQLDPAGTAPQAMAWSRGVYDPCPGAEALLLFGGYNGQRSASDVWELSVAPTGNESWRRVETTGARPRPRDSGAVAFDRRDRRLVTYGGWDGPGNLLRDTWALEMGACAVPTPATSPPPATATTGPPATATDGPPPTATGRPQATATDPPPTTATSGPPPTATMGPPPTSTGAAPPTATPGPSAPPGTGPCPDAFEPDDSWFGARSLEVGGARQRHNFQPAGDVDYARFEARRGQRYEIRTGDLAGGADTRLFLYGGDGQSQLAWNDDSPDDAPASMIDWTSPESGIYYLMAANADPRRGGCTLEYRLWISTAGPGGNKVYLPAALRGTLGGALPGHMSDKEIP